MITISHNGGTTILEIGLSLGFLRHALSKKFATTLRPDAFDTTTREARILLESRIRFNLYLFPVREGDDEFFQHWVAFFGHDRNGAPKGLVEVLL